MIDPAKFSHLVQFKQLMDRRNNEIAVGKKETHTINQNQRRQDVLERKRLEDEKEKQTQNMEPLTTEMEQMLTTGKTTAEKDKAEAKEGDNSASEPAVPTAIVTATALVQTGAPLVMQPPTIPSSETGEISMTSAQPKKKETKAEKEERKKQRKEQLQQSQIKQEQEGSDKQGSPAHQPDPKSPVQEDQ